MSIGTIYIIFCGVDFDIMFDSDLIFQGQGYYGFYRCLQKANRNFSTDFAIQMPFSQNLFCQFFSNFDKLMPIKPCYNMHSDVYAMKRCLEGQKRIFYPFCTSNAIFSKSVQTSFLKIEYVVPIKPCYDMQIDLYAFNS